MQKGFSPVFQEERSFGPIPIYTGRYDMNYTDGSFDQSFEICLATNRLEFDSYCNK